MFCPRIIFIGLRIALILGLLLVYIRYIESRNLFRPSSDIEALPKDIGLDFEDVYFKTDHNIVLNGWFIPYANATKTVVFCHGNAGNISHRLEKIKVMHDAGFNVFIFDYKSYGKSKGKSSEKGLYYDAESALNYLLSKGIAEKDIVSYGESLGGVVAVALAYKHKLSGLIVDSSFTSGKDMAKLIYPFFPSWIFSVNLDSMNKVKFVVCPKLFMHSVEDEIIPYELGRRLFNNASEPKEFAQLHGGHNSCFWESQKTWADKVTEFLKGLK